MANIHFDKTQIDSQIVISEADFKEFQALKTLALALGIESSSEITTGSLIRMRRAKEFLSTAELAKVCGLDRGNLKRIEDDKVCIQLGTIKKISTHFGSIFGNLLEKISKK